MIGRRDRDSPGGGTWIHTAKGQGLTGRRERVSRKEGEGVKRRIEREIYRGEGEGLTGRRGGIKERGFLKGGGGGLKGIGLKSLSRRIHKKYGIIADNFFLFPLLFYR